MLRISLYEDERMKIGADIEVRIIAINRLDGRRRVELGIDAPRELRITRHGPDDTQRWWPANRK